MHARKEIHSHVELNQIPVHRAHVALEVLVLAQYATGQSETLVDAQLRVYRLLHSIVVHEHFSAFAQNQKGVVEAPEMRVYFLQGFDPTVGPPLVHHLVALHVIVLDEIESVCEDAFSERRKAEQIDSVIGTGEVELLHLILTEVLLHFMFGGFLELEGLDGPVFGGRLEGVLAQVAEVRDGGLRVDRRKQVSLQLQLPD